MNYTDIIKKTCYVCGQEKGESAIFRTIRFETKDMSICGECLIEMIETSKEIKEHNGLTEYIQSKIDDGSLRLERK